GGGGVRPPRCRGGGGGGGGGEVPGVASAAPSPPSPLPRGERGGRALHPLPLSVSGRGLGGGVAFNLTPRPPSLKGKREPSAGCITATTARPKDLPPPSLSGKGGRGG